MTIKDRIYNYLTEQGIHTAKEILVALNLNRAITDKYLSQFTKQGLIYRVGEGKYCKNKLSNYNFKRNKEYTTLRMNFPKLYWVWSNARKRCNSLSHKDYKFYGAKGIKCEMLFSDVVTVWFRDKGWELKHPSIDRINSEKSYTLENIRFIEQNENTRRIYEKS